MPTIIIKLSDDINRNYAQSIMNQIEEVHNEKIKRIWYEGMV